MDPTRGLRTKLKQVVAKPLPDSVLQSKLVQRVAGQTSRALELLSDAVEKAGGRKSGTAKELKTRLDGFRTEVDKLSTREKKSKATETAPKQKRKTEKPMPEMIHTHSGGKRLPAAVAKRAVRKSGTDFKPKKGKKHR